MSVTSRKKAEEFLSVSSQYKLGSLVTESAHPETKDLSSLARENLPEAVSVLQKLDRHTINVLSEKSGEICHLKESIRNTLHEGGNVYFCGCGATGRLSLTIETLWRQKHHGNELADRVFSFMAGGDVALIRSIENFEDFPQYGSRQLVEAGFRDGDMLIGTTEGGETPFVIGAVEKASQLSARMSFFLYCNPDDLLSSAAERSKRIIANQSVGKINLTVGPMAVTGSTRMQSSTILLAAAGLALLCYDRSNDYIKDSILSFRDFWNRTDISFISRFILKEADIYKNSEYVLYETDSNLGITIMTDTTERSPTFSLYPFENENTPEEPASLCYIYLPESPGSRQAWTTLLWREPRTLEWPDINGIASMHRLLGFDFSRELLNRRKRSLGEAKHHNFRIRQENNAIRFSLDDEEYLFDAPFREQLFVHLLLKMILNTHSTIVMGRLGRYEGNVMTYVRASNNKLIDRAIRYIDLILVNKGIRLSYEELAYSLIEMLEKTPVDHAIVLDTVDEIEKRYSSER
jgi:N-acetylmuramic acid 6-phosphate etherase